MGMGRVDDVSLICSLENWPSMSNRKRRSWQRYVELVPGGVSCKCLISLYMWGWGHRSLSGRWMELAVHVWPSCLKRVCRGGYRKTDQGQIWKGGVKFRVRSLGSLISDGARPFSRIG